MFTAPLPPAANPQFMPLLAEVHARAMAASSVVITTHENPDGDAIGSSVGLYHLLRDLGKEVFLAVPNAVPQTLLFMLRDVEWGLGDEAVAAIAHRGDLLIVLDVNRAARTAPIAPAWLAGGRPLCVVDHHAHPEEGFGSVVAVDTEASSTAELIARWYALAGRTPSLPAAEAIYTGIVTDTGGFRYQRTTPELHRIAALLLECGVDPASVGERIYNNASPQRTRLLGMALADMRILLDGKYSLMVVTQEMVDTCGASFEITEGFVSHTIELAGVVVGIFAKVKPEGVRLSIRTRAGVSAIAIATQFGGGGHFYAAGGSMPPTSLPDIEQALLHAVQSVLASDND